MPRVGSVSVLGAMALFGSVAASEVPTSTATTVLRDLQSDYAWLLNETAALLKGCELVSTASPGTILFTPDAVDGYGAQWTRDFAYAVRNTPTSLWDLNVLEQAVNATFVGQRASDGCIPDRVQSDGIAVYSPGGNSPAAAFSDHAWDNMPFAALLLTSATEKFYSSQKSKDFFCALEPAAKRALDFVNRSDGTGLVFNNPDAPNCTYGFTDTVAKTGHLLFTSLLFVDASTEMAKLAGDFSCGDAAAYEAQAASVAAALDASLWDSQTGLWLAADQANALPDVWGSLYLVAQNLSTPEKRQGAMKYIVDNQEAIFRWGQVRHLPEPLNWNWCFIGGGHVTAGCPANGTYQNGAFWATPLHYFVKAAQNVGEGAVPGVLTLAQTVMSQAMDYFRGRAPGGGWQGVNECVDPPINYHGVDGYVASGTNALEALSLLLNNNPTTGSKPL